MTQENVQRLKVVLEELEQGIAAGVQARGCDPLISLLPGATLEEALARVPELVAQARERWAQQPRYPAYQRPPASSRGSARGEPPRQQPARAATQPAQPRRAGPQITQQRLI